MPRTIKNHKGNFISTEVISKYNIKQGQLLNFNYTSSTKNEIRDTQPFVLFLGLDTTHNLIHALTLNPLGKREISSLFKKLNRDLYGWHKELSDLYEVDHKLKVVTLSKITVGDFNNRSKEATFGKKLYQNVIDEQLTKKRYDIYRTYKLKNVKNIRLVRYKWDIDYDKFKRL